jgi:ferritin-like metal-binding protein YciE
MAAENMQDVIRRYLKDAIAAEKSFESQLRGFAKEGNDPKARALFEQHAEETRGRTERLISRLKDLGDTPSAVKSFIAQIFSMAPATASIGHDESERVVQNLIVAYTIEHAKIAMYESLATVAEAVADGETAAITREIQHEIERAARKVWVMISVAAAQSVSKSIAASR